MRILAIALAVLICAPLAGSFPAFGQAAEASALFEELKANAPPPRAEVPAAQNGGDYGAYKIEEEISRRTLILAVIAAAIVSLLIVLWFLKMAGTRDASTMVSASGLVLVVYATVLVVMSGKTDQQLTAAMGILGAIAGYLFGTATKASPGTPAGSPPKSE